MRLYSDIINQRNKEIEHYQQLGYTVDKKFQIIKNATIRFNLYKLDVTIRRYSEFLFFLNDQGVQQYLSIEDIYNILYSSIINNPNLSLRFLLEKRDYKVKIFVGKQKYSLKIWRHLANNVKHYDTEVIFRHHKYRVIDVLVILALIQDKSNFYILESIKDRKNGLETSSPDMLSIDKDSGSVNISKTFAKDHIDGIARLVYVLLHIKESNTILQEKGWSFANNTFSFTKNSSNQNYYLTRSEMNSIIK